MYGLEGVARATEAFRRLEEATLYAKTYNYNIGFTSDWVIRNSTDVPGYYWRRLEKSSRNYAAAAEAFAELAKHASDLGRRQAQYMADLCHMSRVHIDAVAHLQNAKLPLVGYKAWPVGNAHASWPPPEKLADLAREARQALELEQEYMRTYAKWVTTCDEQGQLAMHHQGVMIWVRA